MMTNYSSDIPYFSFLIHISTVYQLNKVKLFISFLCITYNLFFYSYEKLLSFGRLIRDLNSGHNFCALLINNFILKSVCWYMVNQENKCVHTISMSSCLFSSILLVLVRLACSSCQMFGCCLTSCNIISHRKSHIDY